MRTEDAVVDLEQRNAEYHAIFEGVAIAIALVDHHRRPIRCNQALQRLLGYTEDELCRMTFPELTDPEDANTEVFPFERMLRGEIEHYQLEKRYVRRDKEIIRARLTCCVAPPLPDNPRYIVALVEDITDHKKLEQALKESQSWEVAAREEFARELLEATDKERRALGAELHDSLGQDLSIISNRTCQALAQPALPPALVEHLKAISESAASAISELRGLVRDLCPIQIEQSGFTDAIRQLVGRIAETGPAHLEFQIDNVDDEIKGPTATSLYRVAQEALNNFMRHSNADRARFTLERDIKCIRLSLWDNGRGFEMKPEGSRHGLGLTSLAERARLIGGKIEIQTGPGTGTRIVLELPLESE